MDLGRLGVLLAVSAALVRPQASPTFEVASIKPSGPHSVRGSEGGPGSSDPEFYRFGRVTLLDLIMHAYDVEDFQISSSKPLDRQNFDLVAKVPASATKGQFRLMLQNLLAERFHLKFHNQTRKLPAYELVVAKTGPKLKETGGDAVVADMDGWPALPPNGPGIASRNAFSGGLLLVRLRSHQEPLSQLAELLRASVELPVVEKTGLSGRYDFNLEFTTGMATASDAPVAPSVFSALRDQLGLQLIRTKVPFQMIVVDAFTKSPEEN